MIRYLWASPNTLLGLVLFGLALLTGGRGRVVDGVLEVWGGIVGLMLRRCVPLTGGAAAMTLGHVILGCDAGCLERARNHEHVHVRQYERWGPLFIPAYFTGALVAWLRGGEAYRDNPFERAAFTPKTIGEPPRS